MYWGHGLWCLFPFLWIIGLILVGSCLASWFGFRRRMARPSFGGPPPFGPQAHEPSALEILGRRYARGEIDTATFEQMRERLENINRPKFD